MKVWKCENFKKLKKKIKNFKKWKSFKKSNISKISKISKSVLKSAVLPASLMPLLFTMSQAQFHIFHTSLCCHSQWCTRGRSQCQSWHWALFLFNFGSVWHVYCSQCHRHNLAYSIHLCAITISGVPEAVHNINPNEHQWALLPQCWRSIVPAIWKINIGICKIKIVLFF